MKNLFKTILCAVTLMFVLSGNSFETQAAVDVSYSASNESLTVTGSDSEVMYRVCSTVNSSGRTCVKDTAWTVMPAVDDKVSVDLSTLNYLKENVIQVRGLLDTKDKDFVTIRIPAQNKYVAGTVDKETGKVTIVTGSSKKDAKKAEKD